MNSKMKLDMSHGFIQSIIKNQVDRDKYDKEVKAKIEKPPKPVVSNQSSRPKKPERQTYVPPAKGNRQVTYPTVSSAAEDLSERNMTEQSSSDRLNNSGECNGSLPCPSPDEQKQLTPDYERSYHYERSQPVPMFLLRYEDECGDFHETVVHRSDDPFVLARRFGNEQGLTPPMIKALSKCLREEMRRRTRQPESEQ
ncbi:UPF0561 protein C2orf68 homolog [Tubulanus polymorphus]|uniref:UPF0561 protein C2orf68 homolog n=1 Tax=Tubulanus polymorphus TaxID=672921 RepID=UPI003DA5120F